MGRKVGRRVGGEGGEEGEEEGGGRVGRRSGRGWSIQGREKPLPHWTEDSLETGILTS